MHGLRFDVPDEEKTNLKEWLASKSKHLTISNPSSIIRSYERLRDGKLEKWLK